MNVNVVCAWTDPEVMAMMTWIALEMLWWGILVVTVLMFTGAALEMIRWANDRRFDRLEKLEGSDNP